MLHFNTQTLSAVVSTFIFIQSPLQSSDDLHLRWFSRSHILFSGLFHLRTTATSQSAGPQILMHYSQPVQHTPMNTYSVTKSPQ